MFSWTITSWLAIFVTRLYRLLQKTVYWAKNLPVIHRLSTKSPGWQAGVMAAIMVAALALICNLSFLILAALNQESGPNGLGTLLQGDCNTVDTWNKIAHGLINVLSTLLLMQSNFCMQLLISPTRRDVDIAHKKRQWVDVGIPSLRNILQTHISPWRCICWIVLAFSSAPLHLLWNSVIIFSPSAFQYNQLVVTEGFTRGLPFNDQQYIDLQDSDEPAHHPERLNPTEPGPHWPDNLYFLQQELPAYEKLTILDCKRAYAQSFVQDRADVVVITLPEQPDINSSVVLGAASGGWGPWPYKWLCPDGMREKFECYGELLRVKEELVLSGYQNAEATYCLSKRMEQRCKIEYGFWITILTVVANALKLLGFIVTYWMLKHYSQDKKSLETNQEYQLKLLITTDDAIASFLSAPDSETLGMSIVEKKDFENGIWNHRWVSVSPMLWTERFKCAWFRAIGLRRWLFGNFLLSVITFVPGAYLLTKVHWLTHGIELNQAAIKQLGIGNPSGLFLFGSWSGRDQLTKWDLVGKIALANTPQLAVSFAYYLWNNHLTALIAASEYDMFAAPTKDREGNSCATNKRGLRVTDPRKETSQRSTRFLTVPLRYWIPNTILWSTLHYLASQAVFFARVDVLDHWLETTPWSISQIGYSVLGLIYFFVCALIVSIYTLCIALRRLPNRMPLAATCSGALSAACHPRDSQMRHHERMVYWGVEDDDCEQTGDKEDDREMIRRCTFTSADAYYPETDCFYA